MFSSALKRQTAPLGWKAASRRSFGTSPMRNAGAEVKSLGVVGAGQMGLGIALVAAQKAAVPVTVVDSSRAALDKGMAFAEKLLARDVTKERLTASQATQARSLLRPSTSLSDLSDVDFVIEAVPEIERLKLDIFAELARVCPAHAVLATNTSSISITRIAAAAAATTTTTDPAAANTNTNTNTTTTPPSAATRVVSTHFMNPVPVQKGVEIIGGLQTSEATLATAVRFCEAMGKVASRSADTPGFIANRVLMPYINEAVLCLETGVGDRDAIDAIMRNGTNVPMGPLQLADFIGLDTCLAIMKVLHQDTGDSKYRPSVLLTKMVDARWLGKKAGKGFYDY